MNQTEEKVKIKVSPPKIVKVVLKKVKNGVSEKNRYSKQDIY